MNLLLDTHSFLWFAEGDHTLSNAARDAIEDSNNRIFLSLASVWGMAIKISIKKLSITGALDQFIFTQVSHNGFELLPIQLKHVVAVAQLNHFHRDPFDRLLIAQAAIERMSVIGHDEAFDRFGVNRI